MTTQAETLLDEAVETATVTRIPIVMIFVVLITIAITMITTVLVVTVTIPNDTTGRVRAAKNLWILTRNVGPAIASTIANSIANAIANITTTTTRRPHRKARPAVGGKTGSGKGYAVMAVTAAAAAGSPTGS